MEIGTPFIIDNTHEEFENHTDGGSTKDSAQNPLPFEFSRTRMWNENFYSPEIGCGHSIAALGKELGEIRILLSDIKDMLSDIFELE